MMLFGIAGLQKIARLPVLGHCIFLNFASLKKLRSSISREENVPAYIVFSDKSLKAMASQLPITEKQFLSIHGVGMNKMEKYGEKFIEVI